MMRNPSLACIYILNLSEVEDAIVFRKERFRSHASQAVREEARRILEYSHLMAIEGAEDILKELAR